MKAYYKPDNKYKKIFFTADHHFGHKNILSFCKRPFDDIESMDNALIDLWNKTVGKNDLVFHLGDFCYRAKPIKYLEQLNGDIILIRGNHDGVSAQEKNHFLEVRDLLDVMINEQKITCCHYPMLQWRSSQHGAWHFHGHCHGNLCIENLKHKERMIDVGVDSHSYKPVFFNEILEIINNRLNKSFKNDEV